MLKKGMVNMATIATHNGSSVSRGHNLRKDKIVSKESHIDPNGIHEIWYDVAPRQVYEQIFGQAVEEYNKKQTRADRKITNYYNEVRADQRRHVTYEMIIGVYPNEEESIAESDGKNIMRMFCSTWKERNPNLELTGVYYHADEQGKAPHVHIDYIPVAHGYNRGPEVQNGLVKALGEMGFEKKGKETAQIQWEKRENEILEAICNDMGITVEHPDAGKGVKHLHTQVYKEEQELKQLKRRQKDTYESLLETRRDVLKKQMEVSSLNSEKLSLNDNMSDLKEELHGLEDKTKSSMQQLQELNGVIGGKRKQLKQLEEKYLEADAELQTVNETLQKSHTERKRLEADISTLKNEKDELEASVASAKRKRNAYINGWDDAKGHHLSIVELSARRKAINDSIQEKQAILDNLTQTVKECITNIFENVQHKFALAHQIAPIDVGKANEHLDNAQNLGRISADAYLKKDIAESVKKQISEAVEETASDIAKEVPNFVRRRRGR